MPSLTAASLRSELAAYGVGKKSLTLLGTSPSPDTVDYLDLLPAASDKKPTKILPDAVAESQDRPLLYVVDHARLASDDEQRKREIHQLSRLLGCRGERAYLAIVEPGQLRISPFSVSDGTSSSASQSGHFAVTLCGFEIAGLIIFYSSLYCFWKCLCEYFPA